MKLFGVLMKKCIHLGDFFCRNNKKQVCVDVLNQLTLYFKVIISVTYGFLCVSSTKIMVEIM